MPDKESRSGETVAGRLRVARDMAGLSQAQAAGLLGLHRPSISELEAGRRRVSVDELKHLAEIYGVSTSWLLGEAPPDRASEENLRLAARELASLRDEDLNRLLTVIRSLRITSEQTGDEPA